MLRKSGMVWACVCLGLVLAGCTAPTQARLAAAGAGAADSALRADLWGLCNAASVGAINREFGGDKKRAACYPTICQPTRDQVLALIENGEAEDPADDGKP